MAGTVLLLGAGGFLAGFIESALVRAGWRVRRVVRTRVHGDDVVRDLGRMRAPGDWEPLLDGVGAVVNAAGILRETAAQDFESIHHAAPLALARACAARGIGRFVQVSALGDARDGGFIASKHRFDAALLQVLPQAVVLRPSVVYSTAGSYGGTSLLRALAALPAALVVPAGELRLQPLAAEDLAGLVARALAVRPHDESIDVPHGIHEVGGPEAMTLRAYLLAWRRWLRVPGERTVRVPMALASLAAAVAERLGGGPLGATAWRMLRRGNVTAPGAHDALRRAFGSAPRALADVLAERPSHVQDRWHARLALLAAPLKWLTVALWLVSAWTGLRTGAIVIESLAAGSALAAWSPVALARAAAWVDLVLGLWLMMSKRPRVPVTLMIASVLAYTAVFGLATPSQWLDPLGGLAKNLLVLPALAVLWVVSDRR